MSAQSQEQSSKQSANDNATASEEEATNDNTASPEIEMPSAEEEAMAAALDAAADAMSAKDQQASEIDVIALKEEAGALKDQLLRAVAETENVRRRAERDLEESSKYAIAGFARDLLSVKENLFRATESIPQDAREENDALKNLGEGVDMTLRELTKIFEKRGITRIQPEIGEKFDHNKHQAVSQIEDDNAEPGSILQILQSGYQLHDRLLQPAMVIVAKASAGSADNNNGAAVDTKA